MTFATQTAGLSSGAKSRIEATEGGPFLLSDWARAVFIHYEVDPTMLQRQVPFELDLRDGRAYVSLVAFTIQRLRFAFGGRFTEWVSSPISRHGFLNLRTYVQHQDEPGIYFLAEWLPNVLSVIAGPRTFGLPYRWGRLDYRHDHEIGTVEGRVVQVLGGGELNYAAEIEPSVSFTPVEADSLDEFLLERYTAFTKQGNTHRRFRIWHEPWRQIPLNIQVNNTSLLAQTGPWFEKAQLVGACYSPGVRGVWMGRPCCINGPGCLTTGVTQSSKEKS